MYSTPISFAPIWVASRLRCDSPPLERRLVPARMAVLILVAEPDLLLAGAVEQHVALLLRKLRPGFVHVDPEVLAHRLEQLGIEELRFAPGGDRAFVQRQRRIRNHQVPVDHELRTDAGAHRACTMWVVEREVARLWLGHARPVVRTREVLRHLDLFALVDWRDDHRAAPQPGRRLDRVDEAGTLLRSDHDPVDDDLDVVLLVLVHRDLLADLVQAAVDAHAHET